MRKIQKILLGSFLTGVLICRVGAGTAIGEYSSLTYLGERTLGEEKLDRKSTRLNSSHVSESRMPSSA